MASAAEVRTLLEATSLPAEVADDFLAEASAVWLMGERADVLAADLSLCHPPLGDGEVRACVRPVTTPHSWRLTVVAADRPGVLAALAGTLASQGLSIVRATATALPSQATALISAVVGDPAHRRLTKRHWDKIGETLRTAVGTGQAPQVAFEPAGPVRVRTSGEGGGRVMVTVSAPDRVGLLWAIADCLAGQGCNIEAIHLHSFDDRADDTFVVDGEVDAAELVTRLSGKPPASGLLPALTDLATWPMRTAFDRVGRMLRR